MSAGRLGKSAAAYYLLALIGFFILAGVYTWPVLSDFKGTIPGFYATDQDQNIWNLWWIKKALVDLRTNPFQTSFLFYPYGTNLYLHALGPLNGVLVLPWSIFAGPIAAFNASAIFGLTFTGLAATALGKTVSGSKIGGLVAGYIITYGPIHFTYVALGQIEFINLWPLLLYIVFLVKLLEFQLEPVPEQNLNRYGLISYFLPHGIKWVIAGAAVMLILSGLVTLYYVAFAALITLLLGLLKVLQEPQFKRWGATVSRLILIWVSYILVLGYQNWRIWQSTQSGAVILASKPFPIINESVPVGAYLNEIDGNLFGANLLGIARNIPLNRLHYIGLGVIILALAGTIFSRKYYPAKSEHSRFRNNFLKYGEWPWAVLALFFAAASLGPSLRFDRRLNPQPGSSQLWLPWNWLQAVPLLNFSHSPTRLALLTLICTAVLAGLGTATLVNWLMKRIPKKPEIALALVSTLLFSVLFLEGPALPTLSRKIEALPQVEVITNDCERIKCGNDAVLDLPLTLDNFTRDHELMLYGALRQKPIMGGYLSREIRTPYSANDSPFNLFLHLTSLEADIFQPSLSRSVVNLLNDNHIRYVTANQPRFDSVYGIGPAKVSLYLNTLLGQEYRIYDQTGYLVYRVPPPQPSEKKPLIVLNYGWLAPEKGEDNILKRWTGKNAAISIYSFSSTTTILDFEAVSFNRTRHLNLSLNGQQVADLQIEPYSMVKYSLTGLNLKEGENLLLLDTLEPPEVPASFTSGSSDTRTLGIAFRKINFS